MIERAYAAVGQQQTSWAVSLAGSSSSGERAQVVVIRQDGHGGGVAATADKRRWSSPRRCWQAARDVRVLARRACPRDRCAGAARCAASSSTTSSSTTSTTAPVLAEGALSFTPVGRTIYTVNLAQPRHARGTRDRGRGERIKHSTDGESCDRSMTRSRCSIMLHRCLSGFASIARRLARQRRCARAASAGRLLWRVGKRA